MKLRIDKVSTDKDGRVHVHYTAVEGGRSLPAGASSHALVFENKAALIQALADDRPASLTDAFRLAVEEWRKIDGELSNAALAVGKIGDPTAAAVAEKS